MVAGKSNSKKNHLLHVIRFVIAAVAIYFAFQGQSLAEVGKVFLNIDISVFVMAVALYVAGQFVFVCRWRVLLWAQKIHIDFWPTMKLHFLGLFYNNCLPGSVGGDLLRAWYVTKHTDKKVEAALSVFVDRAIGLFCTIGMIFGAYWLIPLGEAGGLELSGGNFDIGSKLSALWPVLAVAVGAGAVGVAIMFMTTKGKGLLLAIWSKFLVLKAESIKAFKLYMCNPLAILMSIVLSIGCQGMTVMAFWMVGRNLGIEAHFKYYLMFFPMSWIIGIIPISIGGAGVMELGLKGMFARVTTVSSLQGLVLGLTQRIIMLVTSLPGVVIHMVGAHLPSSEELKSEITEEIGE